MNKTCPVKQSDGNDEQEIRFMNNLCYCISQDDEYEYCDVICPHSISPLSCYCKNRNLGGDRCDKKICRFHSVIYYENEVPKLCATNIDRNRIGLIPVCPCLNGQVDEGKCVCSANFTGFFCDTPFGTEKGGNPIMGRKKDNSGIAWGVGIFCGIFLLAIILAMCARRRKKRGLEGCPPVYSGQVSVRDVARPDYIATPTTPSVIAPFQYPTNGPGRRDHVQRWFQSWRRQDMETEAQAQPLTPTPSEPPDPPRAIRSESMPPTYEEAIKVVVK